MTFLHCARRFARPLVVLSAVLALFASGLGTAAAQTPTAGQNINMVSGTTWPGGDPFLQRQNEPSMAVSSRNSLHLLAGANDYRTVDLPVSDTVPGSLAGDAWLGVFKSYDGGLTWQSYLLPGYPQDNSQPASPLKAYSAAADPTVRAGAGGLFYYSGIAFNRGTNNGSVFVSTFFDTNAKENGSAPAGKDAIQYGSTTLVDTGTSGQFLDKTWIAVDVPRGGGTCTFNALGQTQTVPAGNVYIVWSRFTGSQSTKIMFSRSLDCGKTWSNPTKLSESSSINQGTNVAIDPTNGKVYVAWRAFATSSSPDSIIVARSDDFGASFASKNTNQVATITAFDQSISSTRFRTNALPSIAVSVDQNGASRVHVVWAQRVGGVNQDARIVMSTSSNDGKSWSAPAMIDAFGGSVGSGHQFMPQITFSAGRLMVVYYDQRLDHTLALFKPTGSPFLGFYDRTQAPRGELVSPGGAVGAGLVFKPFIDDDPGVVPNRRHTVDLRVAEAFPSSSPNFSSTLVSQYRMGLWGPDSGGIYSDDEDQPISPQPPDKLYQQQVNAPNLPMFALGTLPFLGDYIDIAGQAFVSDPVSGQWRFNTSAANAPVFYATWTDNRDVVPPADATGFVDWRRYTPPISDTNAGNGTSTSIIDPTQKIPACQPAYTGSRNQNIYMSRITEGLLVGSPQDAKPLSPTLERAFVVTLQNQTKDTRTFHLAISNQPPGGHASFTQGTAQTTLDIAVPGGTGAARPIFVTSSSVAASFTVNVTEAGGLGLAGSVVFNPEGSVSTLAQPDGTAVPIDGVEVYTPSFQVWNSNNPNPYIQISDPNASLQNITNQNITNQNITNADPAIQNITNQNITNQNITNQNITNQNITNVSPAVQNITNQNITNQNITNTTAANQNITNQNITNQNITNQNITNTPITDATYAVTNTGNTAHSYRIALFGQNTNNPPLQLIVTKNSATPRAAADCTLQSVPQSLALARADAAPVTSSLSSASNPNIPDGADTNATVAIAPGETVFVTLRGQLSKDAMAALAQQLTPVVTAHGKNTNGASNDFALLLSIQTTPNGLPGALVGVTYNATLQSIGGKTPITWTLTSGTLPAGLSLSNAGVISGTPTGTGTFTFTVQAVDSSATPQRVTQTLNLIVDKRSTSTAVSLSPASVAATAGSVATVTVTDSEPSGTPSAPSGSVTVSGDGGATGGTCTLASTGPNQAACTVTVTAPTSGTDTITGTYAGSTTHKTSNGTATLTVTAGTTSTAVTSSLGAPVVGQPVTVTATVSATSTGVTSSPTGSVSFSSSVTTDAVTPASCTLSATGTGVSACSVSVTANSASPHVITASYAGVAGVSQPSLGTVTLNVSKRATSTGVSVSSPVLAGQPASVTVTVTDVEASGAKSSPAGVVSLSSSAAGDAFAPSSACTLVAGTPGVASCSLAVSGSVVGARTLTAAYAGSAAHLGSGATGSLTINGNTSTTITTDSPAPSVAGQVVAVSFSVAPVAPAVGTPSGTVTVTNGAGASCTATLASATGTCSLTLASIGTVTLTATYGGDAQFSGSAGTRQHSVVAGYTFLGFQSPLATAGTLASPTDSGTSNLGHAIPIKWQLLDNSGKNVTLLSSTASLKAVAYAGTACSGLATGAATVLYLPTVGATGGSTFRSSGSGFIFNWDTSSVGAGCYELVVQFDDGSTKATTVRLR